MKGGDEFGQLGHGFNVMVDRISEFNKELQEKIDAAVSDCRVSNRKLIMANRNLEKANTELQKQQEQIVHSEKMAAMGQLAAGVAHEINNPLGSILTYIKLSLKKIDRSSSEAINMPQLRTYLATIEKELNRCKKITKGLLDCARIRDPELSEVEVYDVIKNAFALTTAQMSRQGVSLIKRIDVKGQKIIVDPYQLQQVFINIILNALHAMPGGGTLEVIALAGAEFMSISFNDTGCGIPENSLSKIFTPFFTTKKVGEGTGLGLSVAYGIIKNHNGEIKIDSVQGRGTTVTILLPGSSV